MSETAIANVARSFLLTEAASREIGSHFDVAVFSTRGWSTDRPGWDDIVTAGFLACEEEGLLESAPERGLMSDQVAYRVTDRGRRLLADTDIATLRDALGSSPSNKLPSSGDRALWLWLIRSGGPICFMDTTPDISNGNVLHLKACGINFDRSTAVRDDMWKVQGGTFAEPERQHGVGGEAVCRCGLVGGSDRVGWREKNSVRPEGGGPLQMRAEVTGIVDLLRAML